MNPTSPQPEKPLPFLQPEEHVLSTLEADGSRRWLKPCLSQGKLWHRRRFVAYFLIAVFTLLPFVKLNGHPLILLDIVARRFSIFGMMFHPTDTLLLAIFVVGILISIFLFTALFGRVWCGWACPQTVYMEYVFRPIERWLEGQPRLGKTKEVPAWRTGIKYAIYFVLCVYLANTFLAYFIGVDRLSQWVTQSPLNHPLPFAVMAVVTFAMMVDFCYFREQMCLIACPYGRFQSVLLDENSLVVAYDKNRGEPRGKKKKPKADESSNLPVLGDCIDCRRCVTTCPTGIDIRDGLQMECINCTQCIDACDDVMTRINRPTGLIRYSSQAYDINKSSSLLRARTLIYPVLLCAVFGLFVFILASGKSFDAVVIRERGVPHTIAEDGSIRNVLKIKLTNRSNEHQVFQLHLETPEVSVLEIRQAPVELEPSQTEYFHIEIRTPKESFSRGRANCQLTVSNDKEESRSLTFGLIGPFN